MNNSNITSAFLAAHADPNTPSQYKPAILDAAQRLARAFIDPSTPPSNFESQWFETVHEARLVSGGGQK